ncbi:MAG TPA: TetR/AcrR family transcriptional regulator C-terminal domain-containing protein [Aurantimonas sp.]|jgi:AcrR family transcriptional regulator|nr:TetR/AcrR family transcriptional regulator C-terminal domain-containing protein [Aurantimonas sp.]
MSSLENRAEELSVRQRDVLDAVLDLLTRSQKAPTMTAVARAANCSKETLYRWFGDRDGLLTAMVQWQASRVRGVPLVAQGVTRDELMAGLNEFARNWLTVLVGPTSVALNRLAIAEAGSRTADLGAIVLHNGPAAMARRLAPALEAGRAAGLLRFDDTDTAFRSFFGLVVRDIQIRLLLGDRLDLDAPTIQRDAEAATRQFFALYGVDEQRPAKA